MMEVAIEASPQTLQTGLLAARLQPHPGLRDQASLAPL